MSWSRLFYYNYSIKDGGVQLSPLGNLQCLAYSMECSREVAELKQNKKIKYLST